MKKLMILTTILMALGISTACADNDKPIAVTQLPQKAQLFIKTHFPKAKVALAKLERDFLETRYEVVFTNGSKVEFLKDGDWKELNVNIRQCQQLSFLYKLQAMYPKTIQIHKLYKSIGTKEIMK